MRAKILNASAGSGKTYQLAYKYVRDVVEKPERYRHILAVTFTNKATEEMKSRILKEIHTLASGGESSYMTSLRGELSLDERTIRVRAAEVRSKILHDYSRFTVLTIDTFFQRILRAFIKELGIDLNYNVEIETTPVLTKSADSLIEQMTTDPELQRWLTEFVQERIDEGKKWDVRDGILSLAGELFKEKNKESLSYARSKQELGQIVSRTSASADASKEQVRATARQAVELMASAGVTPDDFTGKSRSFVNYFYTIASGELKPYTATVGKMSLTVEGWCPKGSPAQPLVAQLQPLLRTICDLYDTHLRSWNTADLLRENYRSFALLADLYARVQQLCDEQNMMLLSETKAILSAFIGHNDAPFIYEKVGNRYEHFMIDEFQDTSVKEWENFLPLLQNAMAQSEDTSVVLVGDIKQSIYRWRGGDWKILHSTAQQALGEADTQVVNLRENYRSLETVVEFNNRIIRRVVETDNAALNTSLGEAAERGDISPSEHAALHDTLSDAYREHEQLPRRKADRPGYVCVETFTDQPPIVVRIKELIDKGFRPCDILILVRGATDGGRVAAELLEFKRQNDDPHYRFDVMTHEALIVGNAPISSFIASALRLALNADDSLSRAVCNHYLGRAFDAPLPDEEREFFRTIRLLSPEEAFEGIVMRYNLQSQNRQTAYLQAIHEQIINFSSNKIADIALFLRWWDEQGQNRSLSVEQSDSTVEITTIHKAKGLEKRAVVIPYCSWQLDPKSTGQISNIVWAEARGCEAEAVGRFPVRYKKAMAESGFSAEYYHELVYSHVDNINLLYVALTRAAESLHLFIPANSPKAFTAGSLLYRQLNMDGETVDLAGLAGRYTRTDQTERFEFGEFAPPVPGSEKQGAEHVVLENYPTARADLRLRLPSQRYFEQQDEVQLSPRDFGILMHKAFENAATEADIDTAVAQMQADGTLSANDVETLRQMIAEALTDPIAREWFGGGWDTVRNEHEIIQPRSTALRRPDRVMIRGTKAIVVDYKFGDREAAKYRRQIGEYTALLRQMGYTEVEGYLWYVKRGEIERV